MCSGINLKLLHLVDICNAVVPSVNFDFYTLEATAALSDNFPSTSVQFVAVQLNVFIYSKF